MIKKVFTEESGLPFVHFCIDQQSVDVKEQSVDVKEICLKNHP